MRPTSIHVRLGSYAAGNPPRRQPFAWQASWILDQNFVRNGCLLLQSGLVWGDPNTIHAGRLA